MNDAIIIHDWVAWKKGSGVSLAACWTRWEEITDWRSRQIFFQNESEAGCTAEMSIVY